MIYPVKHNFWLSCLFIFIIWVLAPWASGADEKSGLTWGVASHNEILGIDRVGCYGRPRIDGSQDGAPCDPYQGDTLCSQYLPILCLKSEGLPRPNYALVGKGHAMPVEYYNGWAGGHIGLTEPVKGDTLTGLQDANDQCAAALGDGYRMAEHHDGKYVAGMDADNFYGETWPSPDQLSSGGWHWYAFGNLSGDSRFWVHINDQPHGNCWNPIEEIVTEVDNEEAFAKPRTTDFEGAKIAQPEELFSILGANSMSSLFYMGSDESHHYLYLSKLAGGQMYRTPISALRLKDTYPLDNHHEPFLILPGELHDNVIQNKKSD